MGVLSPLPNMTVLPDSFENAWNLVGNFIGALAWATNTTELITILHLAIYAELGYWIYRLGMIIYNAIRGSGN